MIAITVIFGDNAVIDAKAVLLTDTAANAIAVAIPAQVNLRVDWASS